MGEFQDKKKYRRVIYSRPALVVLVIACLLTGRATWDVYSKYSDTETKKASTMHELQDLQGRDGALQADISRLGTDRGREEEIRKKYGFTKPGEKVIVIVDPTTKTDATSTEAVGFWGGVWQTVKSVF